MFERVGYRTSSPINRPNEARAIPSAVVAEDDPSFRRLVVSKLLDDGYEVYEAPSGTEVLRLIAAPASDTMRVDRVDLLIMDHRMPGLTGLEIIRTLRARHWSAPCILMSAFPDAWVREQAAELCVTLLAKPFSLSVLSDVASSLLAQKSLGGQHPWLTPRRRSQP